MPFLPCAVATSVLLSIAAIASAETTSATVVVEATFGSRTSLHVSSDVLQFDVVSPAEPALVTVDFTARARTASAAQVVLSVEPLQEAQGPRGPADAGSALTFSGVGEGTRSGTLAPAGLTVAGQWTGGGLRHGRLVFALRAAAAGAYSIPVRFVLTAP